MTVDAVHRPPSGAPGVRRDLAICTGSRLPATVRTGFAFCRVGPTLILSAKWDCLMTLRTRYAQDQGVYQEPVGRGDAARVTTSRTASMTASGRWFCT